MKQEKVTIISNRQLTANVWEMKLSEVPADCGAAARPGQFINIKLEGLYLRRPISVCDYEDGVITIVYKVVGKGTEAMTALTAGEELDILAELGNGYDLSKAGKHPVLIGGGAGVPPMYMLAKELLKAGGQVTVILGFNTADEVFYEEEFASLARYGAGGETLDCGEADGGAAGETAGAQGIRVIVATADGSYGEKGFVTDVLAGFEQCTEGCVASGFERCSYIYTCGPEPMLKAVYEATTVSGQYSFEERMGCGFGACMGCSCRTKYGNKRICKDGPVLEKEEIIW